jgi:hypothetical protein
MASPAGGAAAAPASPAPAPSSGARARRPRARVPGLELRLRGVAEPCVDRIKNVEQLIARLQPKAPALCRFETEGTPSGLVFSPHTWLDVACGGDAGRFGLPDACSTIDLGRAVSKLFRGAQHAGIKGDFARAVREDLAPSFASKVRRGGRRSTGACARSGHHAVWRALALAWLLPWELPFTRLLSAPSSLVPPVRRRRDRRGRHPAARGRGLGEEAKEAAGGAEGGDGARGGPQAFRHAPGLKGGLRGEDVACILVRLQGEPQLKLAEPQRVTLEPQNGDYDCPLQPRAFHSPTPQAGKRPHACTSDASGAQDGTTSKDAAAAAEDPADCVLPKRSRVAPEPASLPPPPAAWLRPRLSLQPSSAHGLGQLLPPAPAKGPPMPAHAASPPTDGGGDA